VKDVDKISNEIYSDISQMLSGYVGDEVSNTDSLELEIIMYLQTALLNGTIYKDPEVKLRKNPLSNDIVVSFYDKESGKKIESLDEIITPLSKFSTIEEDK